MGQRKRGAKPQAAKKKAEPVRRSGLVDRKQLLALWGEIAVFVAKADGLLSEVLDVVRDDPDHNDREWLDVETVTRAAVGLDGLITTLMTPPVHDTEAVLASPVSWFTTAGWKGGEG